MNDTTDIQPMPKAVKELLLGMGMNDEQAEQTGALGQKIRDFVFDNIGEGDMVSPAELMVASVACKMTGVWFEHVADSEMVSADE